MLAKGEDKGTILLPSSTAMGNVEVNNRVTAAGLCDAMRMIEEGKDCAAVVTQLAAASRALDRAGFKIIASGMRQCVTPAEGAAGNGAAEVDVEQLEKLFLSLA